MNKLLIGLLLLFCSASISYSRTTNSTEKWVTMSDVFFGRDKYQVVVIDVNSILTKGNINTFRAAYIERKNGNLTQIKVTQEIDCKSNLYRTTFRDKTINSKWYSNNITNSPDANWEIIEFKIDFLKNMHSLMCNK